MNVEEIVVFTKKLGPWHVDVVNVEGASRGLALLWRRNTVNFEPLIAERHCQGGLVRSLNTNLKFIVINVYVPTPSCSKREVWIEIEGLLSIFADNIFILGNDFNVILHFSKKKGWFSIDGPLLDGFQRMD